MKDYIFVTTICILPWKGMKRKEHEDDSSKNEAILIAGLLYQSNIVKLVAGIQAWMVNIRQFNFICFKLEKLY